MSHEDLRALVPGYAAGELDGEQAGALRTHLASGCEECLGEMFRRPVGRLRSAPVLAPLAPAVAPPAAAGARGRAVPVAAALTAIVAVGIAGVSVRALADLRRHEAALRADADRVALLVADDRAALEARVARLARELEGARAEASSQAEAARSTRAENLRLEEALRATVSGSVAPAGPGPRAAPEHPAARAPSAWNEHDPPDPAAVPDVRLFRLRAVPPFRDPRGHVLWNPGAEELTVYAFDLPPLPAGAGYHVRLRLDDGRSEFGPALLPGKNGVVSRVIPVAGERGRVQALEVVLEPSARPVLAGRVADAGS